jgi:hypothetical protein
MIASHRRSRAGRRFTARALLLSLAVAASARGGEYGGNDPRRHSWLQRFHPVGGWNPDGRGLFHWWDPCCFPPICGPDDYCRKPIPRVCQLPCMAYGVGRPPAVVVSPGVAPSGLVAPR